MTNRLKETARLFVSRLLVRSGITAVSRTLLPKQGAHIFYGHRVTHDDEGYLQGLSPKWFDEQLTYLTRHYEVIPLTDLVRCLEDRRPVPKGSVVLTFDDGFRDNLENAWPILEKYHVTATIFLVTGSVTSGELPWSQRLGVMFQKSSEPILRHAISGPEPMDLSSDPARKRSYDVIKRGMMTMDRDDRERGLVDLEQALGVNPPRDRMLSWKDAEYLKSRGIEIGAHTYTHPYLARISNAAATWEMERSRDDLRRQLGIERPVFCFPAGSLTPQLVDTARRLGFRGSFMPSPMNRVNTLETVDPFSMRRTGLPNGPAVQLEAELDGPLPSLRQMYRFAGRPFRRSPENGGA